MAWHWVEWYYDALTHNQLSPAINGNVFRTDGGLFYPLAKYNTHIKINLQIGKDLEKRWKTLEEEDNRKQKKMYTTFNIYDWIDYIPLKITIFWQMMMTIISYY